MAFGKYLEIIFICDKKKTYAFYVKSFESDSKILFIKCKTIDYEVLVII